MLAAAPINALDGEMCDGNGPEKDDAGLNDYLADVAGFSDRETRLVRLQTIDDATLLYFHALLHTPAISDNVWIPLLEEEMRKRGLIRPS